MEIEEILDRLKLSDKKGHYKNKLYIIDLANSNEYANVYTLLSQNAINTEYPNFAQNTNKATVKITNYFELEVDNKLYTLFLIADFDNDKYYLKIGDGIEQSAIPEVVTSEEE